MLIKYALEGSGLDGALVSRSWKSLHKPSGWRGTSVPSSLELREYLTADPQWKGGRLSLTIKAGDNTLGTIKVTPAALQKK